ncbi:TRAP transporter permease, partial [Pseudomonas aeruginosa]
MSDHQNGLHLEAENWPRALFAVALAFSVFQVVTAAFPLISTQVLRAMHVGLLLLVVYISYPAFGIGRPWQPLAWLLGMAGLGTAVYQWVFEGDLIQRSGELTQADMVVGVVLIVLVFEAARR